MGRDGRREEDEEPVRARPFTGFRNAVRIYPRDGSAFEYSVDTARESLREEDR